MLMPNPMHQPMNPTFLSTYSSKPVQHNGNVEYSNEENHTWFKLFTQQEPLVKRWACQEYLQGLQLLNFPKTRVPQCYEVTKVLNQQTGWSLEPVPSLIPNDHFFNLLAQRKFPAATFVRREEDFGFVPEPDIFHEMFGHCPLLTNQACADFAQRYGELSLKASPEDQAILARLYWYTLEIGLIKTSQGMRAYGGTLLSSVDEITHALKTKAAQYKPFDIVEVLHTPYRIDTIQPVYFVIENFDTLYQLLDLNLIELVNHARESSLAGCDLKV